MRSIKILNGKEKMKIRIIIGLRKAKERTKLL